MLDERRAAALRCKYFNRAVARGTFALPEFARLLIDPA